VASGVEGPWVKLGSSFGFRGSGLPGYVRKDVGLGVGLGVGMGQSRSSYTLVKVLGLGQDLYEPQAKRLGRRQRHAPSMQGAGRYPTCDPFGVPFSADYHPHRHRLAGTAIAGGFLGILDGVQADQEFVRAMFTLQRILPYM
jgi:hypothetical protein